MTLRAVERFEAAVPIAVSMLNPAGRLALLIGAGQVALAKDLFSGFAINTISVPGSRERVLLTATGTKNTKNQDCKKWAQLS